MKKLTKKEDLSKENLSKESLSKENLNEIKSIVGGRAISCNRACAGDTKGKSSIKGSFGMSF